MLPIWVFTPDARALPRARWRTCLAPPTVTLTLQRPRPAQDPLADLFGAPAPPAPAPAPAPAAFPPVTAFERDGVRAELAFRKPPGAPGQTEVTATYTNAGAAPVTGFALQARPALLPSLPSCRAGCRTGGRA
jgi:hypothetical protein